MSIKNEITSAKPEMPLIKTGSKSMATADTTALYTYLNETLKSPRLRRLLQEGATQHAAEVKVGRRA